MADQGLSDLTREWRRLRDQKHRMRGGVEARTLLALAAYYGEHLAVQARDAIVSRPSDADEQKNKLQLVFNVIKRTTRKKMGRIWSIAHEFHALPSKLDPRAMDQAEVVTKLIAATDHKLRERHRHWLRLKWLLLGGVVVEHIPWIEDETMEPMPIFDDETGELVWRDEISGRSMLHSQVLALVQQTGRSPESFSVLEEMTSVGDVGSEIYGPLNFFIDKSVCNIEDLGPDQWCFFADIRTHGWVEEIFGAEARERLKKHSDLSIVKTRLLDKSGPVMSGTNIEDLVPAIQGARGSDDPGMAVILTGYQPASRKHPHGRRVILSPDQVILDDAESPYEEIPAVDIHWDPNAETFWTPDFVTDLIPGQKFLNKRMSQLGEAANAQLYEILLLGGQLGKEDIPTDYPGTVSGGLDEEGRPLVQAVQHSQLPGWFVDSIRLVKDLVEYIGSSDLISQRQYPGQLRGSLTMPLLQEILDSEDGPFFDHLGDRLARIRQMRVNRIKQFYPKQRTMHYVAKDLRDEVFVFHTEQVLRAGVEYNITVDRSTVLPELSAMREARIRERLSSPLSILYVNRRTGQIDASKIAFDLRYNDRDRESRESQARKLARQLIGRLWLDEALPEYIPLPFWDLNAIMDEFEAAMTSTEFISASPTIMKNFLVFYEKSRTILGEVQKSAAQAVEAQTMQGAIAQATQQAAARAASEAIEAALGQVRAQAEEFGESRGGIEDQLRRAFDEGGRVVPGGGEESRV